MSFNEQLADRVREMLADTTHKVEEKKMFGGLCFMVNDKMCTGVRGDGIMVRLNPERTEDLLEEEGCNQMIMGGRTMKGYVFVDGSALHTKKQLSHWIKMALEFNKTAKSSKKK